MTVEHVQTKREIAAMLDAAGARPRKRFGQNFLIDGNLMRRLVEAAELTRDDVVIEVGAGTGGLTDLLVARAGAVVCVEVDRALQLLVADRFRDHKHFTLISGDALANKHRLNDELARRLRACAEADGAVKLVANLPYQIATPLVMNLLVDYPQVGRLVFTVQQEVGERIIAEPGHKNYGPLAIVAQLLTNVSLVAKLPPEVFWPRPAIHSVMLRMEAKSLPFADQETLRRFVAMLRQVFDHRRKTLRAALRYLMDADTRDEVLGAIEPTKRPEGLSVDEWLVLFTRLEKSSPR